MVKILGPQHCEHWPEYFFLRNRRIRVDVCDHRWFKKKALSAELLPASDEPPSLADSFVDIRHRLFLCPTVDDWSHIIGRIFCGANLELHNFLFQDLQKSIVDFLDDDSPGSRGALLSLKPECGHCSRLSRRFKIRLIVDDDGIFAPHFRNDAFQPPLPRLDLCREFADVDSHLFRTGE